MEKNQIKFSDTIYISAADSAPSDIALSDYHCTGKNDETVIQAAVDSISINQFGEIRGKKIILLPGNYYISDFPFKNKNGRVAVMTSTATNRFDHIAILISGSEHTESTVINITEEAYEKAGENESCSLFGCEAPNWNHHVFKDLYVTVPDDQKNIVCFDGRNMGAMGLRRCKCICQTKGGYFEPKSKLPAEGFIAFMGTLGSNNMWEEKWEFCQAEGFGQGFAVGSEHLLMHKCAALFGRYGFTFNNYFCDYGAIVHPMTMIGCIDEANANFWKFGKNEYKQCINAYNTSFEQVPSWFEKEGNYAREECPGDYVGHIDFVGNHAGYTQNRVDFRFWEDGSGMNFETVNNTHKKICTSDERNSYFAFIGQEVFDTTLNQKLIFTGSGWMDISGNPVE